MELFEFIPIFFLLFSSFQIYSTFGGEFNAIRPEKRKLGMSRFGRQHLDPVAFEKEKTLPTEKYPKILNSLKSEIGQMQESQRYYAVKRDAMYFLVNKSIITWKDIPDYFELCKMLERQIKSYDDFKELEKEEQKEKDWLIGVMAFLRAYGKRNGRLDANGQPILIRAKSVKLPLKIGDKLKNGKISRSKSEKVGQKNERTKSENMQNCGGFLRFFSFRKNKKEEGKKKIKS